MSVSTRVAADDFWSSHLTCVVFLPLPPLDIDKGRWCRSVCVSCLYASVALLVHSMFMCRCLQVVHPEQLHFNGHSVCIPLVSEVDRRLPDRPFLFVSSKGRNPCQCPCMLMTVSEHGRPAIRHSPLVRYVGQVTRGRGVVVLSQLPTQGIDHGDATDPVLDETNEKRRPSRLIQGEEEDIISR